MEWIETTGKTVEEAVSRALHELGIDASELDYHVVQEPKSGFLGIGSALARVRARVRPISREKPDRRRRQPAGRGARGGERAGGRGRGGGRGETRQRERGGERGGRRPAAQQRTTSEEREPASERVSQGKEREMSEVPMEEQADVVQEFLEGLVAAFGLDGQVRVEVDDEYLRASIEGDDLGVLIGPNGATMEATRELLKTALQRRTEGHNARLTIDVAGYEARRRAALEQFARELAQRAIETGRAQVLEPMSSADRKAVHDAVNDVEGVTTTSQGEEPRRRVVIQPV